MAYKTYKDLIIPKCHPNRKHVAFGLCSSCWQKQNLNKNHIQKKKRIEACKNWRDVLREQTLKVYGNGKIQCVLCGFNDIRALQIDHINGGGSKEIRKYGSGGTGQYQRLRKMNYPPGYQTLCANCNWIKRYINKEYPNKK